MMPTTPRLVRLRRHRLIRLMLVVVGLLAVAPPTLAWHEEGHVYAARAAVDALPETMPAFFRQGRDAIAHGALDPDVVRVRELPQLRAAEAPEHFLDSELLRGHDLPETRYDFIRLCDKQLHVWPNQIGLLPYAIVEHVQRLAMAFAEHRRWPDNPHIRAKCLVIAGRLAHYTADLHNPLHTTMHHDGWIEHWDRDQWGAPPSPHIGIHARVDALPGKLDFAAIFEEPLPEPVAHADVMAFIVDELARSYALVKRVYELEPRIPALHHEAIEDDTVRDFTIARTRAAARFTAEVFLSAWRKSATLAPPHWLDRAAFDQNLDLNRAGQRKP